jgi:serpin B
MRIKQGWRTAGAAALAAAVLAACGSGGTTPVTGPGGGEVKAADAVRLTATDTQRSATAAGTEAFGLDLYHALAAQPGRANVVLSPSGLATVLAMLLPGTRNDTERELATALHTTLPPEQYAAADGALDRAAHDGLGKDVALEQSDTVWTQQGFPVQQDYLKVLAGAFDAGLRTADFAKDPEAARKEVNALVEQQTHGLIKDLFGPGSVDPNTLLALTDALYLKADWQTPFKHAETAARDFHLLDGRTSPVPTMAQTGLLRYAAGSGGITGQPWQAVELPYAGGHLAMDLVVPAQGGFEAFRKGLDAPQLDRILGGLAETEVDLALPKFSFETDSNLTGTLRDLGVRSLFTSAADLSGIPGPNAPQGLKVTTVVQKAKIMVDEQGTTAAAGSGVVAGTGAMAPPPHVAQLHIDRPFLFLIRDTATGQPLFLGQVTDPAGS